MRASGLTAILLGLSPTTAWAEPIAQATFDGSRLTPYVNVWKFAVTGPDGKVHPQGLWTDQLMRTTRDGRDVLVRVQGTVYVNGTTSSVVNVFDPATMLPVSDQQTTKGGGLQKRSFNASGVETRRTEAAGSAEKITTTPLPPGLYDYYGGMYALLLSTAPLHAGYRASFSSIGEFEDKIVPVEFVVGGREKAPAGSRGSIDTWKVTSSLPGQYDLIAWISDKAPYVIRLNIIMPNKALYDWTMI